MTEYPATALSRNQIAAEIQPEIQPAGIHMIRLSLGIVYFHFGFLKFYPDLSPAELIASYTAQHLSLYWLDSVTVLWWIAIFECFIGLCLLFNILMRWVAVLFFLHMAATFAPIILLPELAFKFVPLAPTLEGQYILKNLVLVSAGWALFAPYLRDFRIFQKHSPSGEPATPITPSPN